MALYTSLLSGQPPNAPAFDAAARAHLATTTTADQHDEYFNNFSAYWNLRLTQGQIRASALIWPWALRPALAHEAATGKLVHKGSPYFYWATSALLIDDLDMAYLLLNRAFEEDIRTHGSVAPSTPGYAVATLDASVTQNLLQPYVTIQAAALERRLASYRTTYSRTLTLPDFRSRFLALSQMRQTVSMFAYSLARSERFVTFDPQLWVGPFPSQIAFDTLFDLCLVVDDSVHAKNSAQWKFFDHARFLSARASLGLTQQDLSAIRGAFTASFTATLSALLAGSFSLGTAAPLTGLARSLAITYGCRNRGAHAISSTGLTASDYQSTVDHILHTLCLVVDTLY